MQLIASFCYTYFVLYRLQIVTIPAFHIFQPMDESQMVTSGIQGLHLNGTPNEERELTELEKQQLEDEAEGWAVVKKKGRKKKH